MLGVRHGHWEGDVFQARGGDVGEAPAEPDVGGRQGGEDYDEDRSGSHDEVDLQF